MLPLVLGGIALAAVGYGVKEYCEENGCPWDDEVSYTPPKPSNFFADLHREKITLHEEALPKLRALLLRVDNTDEKLILDDAVSLDEEKLENEALKEDVKLYADIYKNVLSDASGVLNAYADEIEILLEISTKYENYNKSQKNLVKKVYKLINVTQVLLAHRLVDDKSEIITETVVVIIDYRKMFEKYRGFSHVH